jgi:uncharacterized membrane protein (UPF0127 family)
MSTQENSQMKSLPQLSIRRLDSFFERLTGALTRPLSGNEALLFAPGGSIHTFFMKQNIDVAFLDQHYNVLKISDDVPPWKVLSAPKGTCYTLEASTGALKQLEINMKIGNNPC